jgi:hypothetical protein
LKIAPHRARFAGNSQRTDTKSGAAISNQIFQAGRAAGVYILLDARPRDNFLEAVAGVIAFVMLGICAQDPV